MRSRSATTSGASLGRLEAASAWGGSDAKRERRRGLMGVRTQSVKILVRSARAIPDSPHGPEDLAAPRRRLGLDARVGPVDLPGPAARLELLRAHPRLEPRVRLGELVEAPEVPRRRDAPRRELARAHAPLARDLLGDGQARLDV